ncbi:MAG: hypothetical protein M1815_003067 [Lichina confinis]|nr:MAG: hypothetical protein M1815_003067 [Lichina confinis]
MRVFSRLLANVKPARFLEPNTPTGLTGLLTHSTPRSTLLYLYDTTLEKLKPFPESSVYRQSTEALTRHRRDIIESVKPEGYDAWVERSKKELDKHRELFEAKSGEDGGKPGRPMLVKRGGTTYVTLETQTPDPDKYEWDGEDDVGPSLEGTRSLEEREDDFRSISQQRLGIQDKNIDFEPEPPLDSNQVADIENRIGAGLVEEVIQVAEGELKLVEAMAEAKP